MDPDRHTDTTRRHKLACKAEKCGVCNCCSTCLFDNMDAKAEPGSDPSGNDNVAGAESG